MPFGRDGSMISEALGRAGMDGVVCADMDELLTELAAGAGAVIIGDEALDRSAVRRFSQLLAAQPHWSDLPVLVMTSGGEATDASQFRLKLTAPLGNVTLLERPVPHRHAFERSRNSVARPPPPVPDLRYPARARRPPGAGAGKRENLSRDRGIHRFRHLDLHGGRPHIY